MGQTEHIASEVASEWLRVITSAGFGRRLLAAIAIVAGAYLLTRLLRVVFERLRKHFVLEAPALYIVQRLGGYLILLVGLLAGLSALGVNLTSLTVFGGAVGVGLGLGLQGIVKEFVSGLVLIFDPSIQIGDFVELEGGIHGEVAEIGTRATRLRTNDNLNVVIPNSTLIQSRVVNWTYSATSRRIHVRFSVAEESDVALVREVVLTAAKALPFTLPDDDDHKTQVWLIDFKGEGLAFDLVVWPTVESSRHPRSMQAAYTWAIYHALRQAGVNNANTQIELRLRSLFGQEGDAALKTLSLDKGRRRATSETPDATAPNDAALAVYQEADRGRRQRAEAPRKRGQDGDPPAATAAEPPATSATSPPSA